MSFTKQDRDDFRSDARFLGGQTVKWVIVTIAIIGLIGAAIWGIRVATSPVRGQGDAYQQKNSAKNWVTKQKEFNQRYQSIKAMDKNITVAAAELKAQPNSQVKQVNYAGLVRNCNDAVGEYNSLAREYDARDFRDADLPAEIDDTDPATDCKEN